jgi:hypothetical protein
MSQPFTFKFKFRLPASEKPPLGLPPLVIDLSNGSQKPDVLAMLAEGKAPIPESLQGLTKGQLSSLGINRIRLSKKHGSRYVDVTPKRYDS